MNAKVLQAFNFPFFVLCATVHEMIQTTTSWFFLVVVRQFLNTEWWAKNAAFLSRHFREAERGFATLKYVRPAEGSQPQRAKHHNAFDRPAFRHLWRFAWLLGQAVKDDDFMEAAALTLEFFPYEILCQYKTASMHADLKK